MFKTAPQVKSEIHREQDFNFPFPQSKEDWEQLFTRILHMRWGFATLKFWRLFSKERSHGHMLWWKDALNAVHNVTIKFVVYHTDTVWQLDDILLENPI